MAFPPQLPSTSSVAAPTNPLSSPTLNMEQQLLRSQFVCFSVFYIKYLLFLFISSSSNSPNYRQLPPFHHHPLHWLPVHWPPRGLLAQPKWTQSSRNFWCDKFDLPSSKWPMGIIHQRRVDRRRWWAAETNKLVATAAVHVDLELCSFLTHSSSPHHLCISFKRHLRVIHLIWPSHHNAGFVFFYLIVSKILTLCFSHAGSLWKMIFFVVHRIYYYY